MRPPSNRTGSPSCSFGYTSVVPRTAQRNSCAFSSLGSACHVRNGCWVSCGAPGRCTGHACRCGAAGSTACSAADAGSDAHGPDTYRAYRCGRNLCRCGGRLADGSCAGQHGGYGRDAPLVGSGRAPAADHASVRKALRADDSGTRSCSLGQRDPACTAHPLFDGGGRVAHGRALLARTGGVAAAPALEDEPRGPHASIV